MPTISLTSGRYEIKGVVFDMDGTLIDSNIDFGLMNDELIKCLKLHGIQLSRDAERQSVHENLASLDSILIDMDRDEALTIRKVVRDVLTRVELAALPVTPFEGVLAMLDDLLEMNIAIGILTRASRNYTITALEHTGIMDRVGTLVCRDDYSDDEAKPNPIAMHRTLESMGVEPVNAIYIGDHRIDMVCARSSKVPFVGVLTGSTNVSGWKEIGCEDVLDTAAIVGGLFN